MKTHLCLLGSAALLSSCGVSTKDYTSTGQAPSRKDLTGTYTVGKVSLLAPQRQALMTASLTLRPDGSYTLHAADGLSGNPLLPSSPSGSWATTWHLIFSLGFTGLKMQRYWDVRFTSPQQSSSPVTRCLDQAPPHRLAIEANSGYGPTHTLIFTKTR